MKKYFGYSRKDFLAMCLNPEDMPKKAFVHLDGKLIFTSEQRRKDFDLSKVKVYFQEGMPQDKVVEFYTVNKTPNGFWIDKFVKPKNWKQ